MDWEEEEAEAGVSTDRINVEGRKKKSERRKAKGERNNRNGSSEGLIRL